MGCAVIEGTSPARWLEAEDLPDYFSTIPWDDTNLIGHNLIFDAGVLWHHYHCVPKLHSCTLSYARAILGALLPRCNLETVAAHFGMRKNTQALFNMLGKRLTDVDREGEAWAEYKAYAVGDAVQAKTIFNMLLPHMPGTERVIVDILIRMFTQGVIELDPVCIAEALLESRTDAANKLARAGLIDKKDLRSRDKFAEMLRGLGVIPPTKTSPATGLQTYAFAKDDLAFVDLLEHPDERVVALVDAKLNASSTIQETRAERLLAIASLDGLRRLQVPLAYSGAHTHRFSGMDKLNLQNIPRAGALRRSLRAPRGYKLVVRDASQIEARILAYVAGEWDLVRQFAQGEDVYASFASAVYTRPINKKDNPAERRIGKTGILGLGYGSGAYTFQHMVLTSEQPTPISFEFAQTVVYAYRKLYPQIAKMWFAGGEVLGYMANGQTTKFGPCLSQFCKLRLPSGLHLSYPQLELVPLEERLHPNWGVEWRYYKPRYRAFTAMFGAKLCLAGDTQVLTRWGWTRLDQVFDQEVWDGSEWVQHSGLKFQGIKVTNELDGVRMTPDHRVMTTEGWCEARSAEGLGRPDVRLPDCNQGCRIDWGEAPLGVPLPLRETSDQAGSTSREEHPGWAHRLLRLLHRRAAAYARHVWAPSLRHLALDARPLPTVYAPGLAQLRCPGDHGLLGVADLRWVLVGHGSDLSAGADHRPARQRAGVLPLELRVANTDGAVQQQAEQRPHQHSLGEDDGGAGSTALGAGGDDPALSTYPGGNRFGPLQGPRLWQPVYDFLDCGPRRQFVVLGESGPMLVHNCENMIQALARIQITDTMIRMRLTNPGWHCALQVHDELVYLAPDDEAEECDRYLSQYLNVQPEWTKTYDNLLPLANEGGIGEVYGDIK